ncbi:hypothetical protein E3N88_32888 [Mikania micrantha]|uniref:Protein kinase domain-containing protein n=1 Tax=Mikania micrantha TaxID=192012 RepID=A0A5N6MCD1_9ASTR|nr:hypothetical protein E3N88_32888 [Mikania micrantha]
MSLTLNVQKDLINPGTTSLSWCARLKIAVGAAQGLTFLHRKDGNARLWDFEVNYSFLDPYSYSFEGGAHYAAPEWYRHHADTYLFQRAPELFHYKANRNMAKWAAPLLAHEANLGMILDKQLQDNNLPPKGAFIFAKLVSNCLQPAQDERPSMETILQVLRECYEKQFRFL